MSKKLLLIDGSSLIHRAFFALPPLMTRQGVHTGAVYGFCTMLLKLLKDVQPQQLVVAFDKSRKTFRTELFADYKGQRKPTPAELSEQFPLASKLLQALNITVLELDQYEADDIIGTLACQSSNDTEVVIVTGDKDELQLIDDRISVMYTKRGISDIKLYDATAFAEEYAGLKPLQLIDLKGLMGDSSDNIPGVPGVGPKTALKLISTYGSVEAVLDHVEDIAGKNLKEKLTLYKEQALLSKRLATICTKAPVPEEAWDSGLPGVKPEAQSLMQELEFKNLFIRFTEALGSEGTAAGLNAAAADLAAGAGSEAQQQESAAVETTGLFAQADLQAVPEVCRLTTGAEAHKLLQALAAGTEQVWFLAEPQGQLPHLTWSKVQLFAKGKLYELEASECIRAFGDWLAASSCPKGTLEAKEVYKVALSQKLQVQNLQDDLALAAYLEDPGRTSYTLAQLCERYLVGNCSEDAGMLPKLAVVLRQQLEFKQLTKLYLEVELPLTAVLAAMELVGVAADAGLLAAKNKMFAAKLAELEQKAKAEAGEADFNPKSPKQLGVILFEKLGLPVLKKTKTGYSTDVSVLEQLSGQHPLVDTILEHRVLAKLHSTYLEGLLPLINKTTGRIHTHFQQMVTVTGRLSSTDPNLQNIPTRTEIGRGIREIFIPGAGYDWLLSCDYSQIELRILAHIAQDELLLESFLHGQDVHARTAAEVFGVPLDQVTPALRSRAKAVNFGIVYGISDFGLAKQIGSSRKEAAQFISSYFQRYTGVKAYMEKMVALAREQGYVTTLLGRRRYLPDIKHHNFNLRSFAERTAINTPIQGTAADIMKVAMLHVDTALRRAGVQSRVLLQVHDELVLEVTEAERQQVADLVQKEMQEAYSLSVPLLAEVGYGKNWAVTK